MAKGKWEVYSNLFNGRKVYRIGRLKDVNEVVHSGNIEYYSDENMFDTWTENLEEKEELVRKLNGSNYGESWNKTIHIYKESKL